MEHSGQEKIEIIKNNLTFLPLKESQRKTYTTNQKYYLTSTWYLRHNLDSPVSERSYNACGNSMTPEKRYIACDIIQHQNHIISDEEDKKHVKGEAFQCH